MSPLVIALALVAGMLGALARYGITRAVARRWPHALTRAVLIVNVIGSVIAGALTGAIYGAAADIHYVLVSGLAGGLTTFSTWSVESIQLVLSGRTGAAVRNVAANLGWGLLAGFSAMVVAGWVSAIGWLVTLT